MSEETTGTVSEPEQLQPGVYLAQVVGVEKKVLKFGEVLEFSFKLLDVDENVPFDTVKGSAGFKNNKIDVGGKLYKWLTIIGNKPLDLSQKIDVSKFVGMQCTVLTENKPSAKSGKIFSNVKEVVPTKKKASQDTAPEKAPDKAPENKAPEKTTAQAQGQTAGKKADDFEF